MIENIIEKHNLSKQEVLSIVWKWYNSYSSIIQDEDGSDLGEICESEYYKIEDKKSNQKMHDTTKKVLDDIFNIYADSSAEQIAKFYKK